jgi:hypothetical protein
VVARCATRHATLSARRRTCQPLLQSLGLDLAECSAVHTRRPRVGFRQLVSVNVLPGSSPITSPLLLPKHIRSKGPSLPGITRLQRALPPFPSPSPGRHPFRCRWRRDLHRAGLPPITQTTFRHAVLTTPAYRTGALVGCFPVRAAFPVSQAGRHPRLHFRGLLKLHSRYGLPVC